MPAICIRRNSELVAEPLVGPGVIGVLIPRMRLVSRKTWEKGVFSLEMVISRDPVASSRAPEGEAVGTATRPSERVASFPTPCFPYWCLQWAGGFDSRRRCLGKRTESHPLVINHNLAGQRERLLLFEMGPRPICCRAFERVGPLVHHYVRPTHRHSK